MNNLPPPGAEKPELDPVTAAAERLRVDLRKLGKLAEKPEAKGLVHHSELNGAKVVSSSGEYAIVEGERSGYSRVSLITDPGDTAHHTGDLVVHSMSTHSTANRVDTAFTVSRDGTVVSEKTTYVDGVPEKSEMTEAEVTDSLLRLITRTSGRIDSIRSSAHDRTRKTIRRVSGFFTLMALTATGVIALSKCAGDESQEQKRVAMDHGDLRDYDLPKAITLEDGSVFIPKITAKEEQAIPKLGQGETLGSRARLITFDISDGRACFTVPAPAKEGKSLRFGDAGVLAGTRLTATKAGAETILCTLSDAAVTDENGNPPENREVGVQIVGSGR